MNTLETIKQKIADINAKKQELVEGLRKDFAPMLQPLFDKSNGKITSFGWTQYTPYFNDGEECTFSTHVDYPVINGEDSDDIDALNIGIYKTITDENLAEHKSFNESEHGHKWYVSKSVGENGYFRNPGYDEDLANLVDEFKQVIKSIDDEFLKDLFGDHVQVTVNADGTIETEEYSHD